MKDRCFACNRVLGKNSARAITNDGQTVFVGQDCHKRILRANAEGYQPPKGGPRLFPLKTGKS